MWSCLLLMFWFPSTVTTQSSSNKDEYLMYNFQEDGCGNPEICKLDVETKEKDVNVTGHIQMCKRSSTICTILRPFKNQKCGYSNRETPSYYYLPTTSPIPEPIRNNCQERKPPKLELITESKTWEDAVEHCRLHNMELVSILDEEKQAWVELKARNANTDFVWLGLRYTCVLDLWFWLADDHLDFQCWAEGGQSDGCNRSAAMKTKEDHLWSVIFDSDKFDFICEG